MNEDDGQAADQYGKGGLDRRCRRPMEDFGEVGRNGSNFCRYPFDEVFRTMIAEFGHPVHQNASADPEHRSRANHGETVKKDRDAYDKPAPKCSQHAKG